MAAKSEAAKRNRRVYMSSYNHRAHVKERQARWQKKNRWKRLQYGSRDPEHRKLYQLVWAHHKKNCARVADEMLYKHVHEELDREARKAARDEADKLPGL